MTSALSAPHSMRIKLTRAEEARTEREGLALCLMLSSTYYYASIIYLGLLDSIIDAYHNIQVIGKYTVLQYTIHCSFRCGHKLHKVQTSMLLRRALLFLPPTTSSFPESGMNTHEHRLRELGSLDTTIHFGFSTTGK